MRKPLPLHPLTLCVLASLAASAGVHAQTKEEGSDRKVSDLATVSVSASRIDRPDLVAPTPTLPITAEELKLDSRTNIGAALNDLPQFRATSSPQTTGSNTGAGNAPVDLRGLGISRTLVLQDGRRISSDNDLNTIPSIVVKSVDVVTGGASAAWGSGAVGGVVNISLDHDFVGFKAGAQAGQSTYNDGKEKRFEAAWGTDFADGRGHFLVGGEFLDNDGIVPRSSRSRAGRWSTLSIGNGQYQLMPDVGFADAGYGGLILSGVLKGKAFNPDGSLRDFQYGRVVGALMSGGEGPSNDDYSPLSAPQKRYSVLASGRYDLNDDVRLTAEVRHSRMYNNYIWFGDHNRNNLDIGIDNAFLPQQVREAMQQAGETKLRIGRFNNDINYPHIDFERKTTQATLALDGYAGDWRWSAYYSHGEAEANFDTPGFILREAWANAIDSVIDPSTGKPVCRVSLANPAVHCVPINVFGEGAPSQEAIDYVTGTPQQRARTTLDVFGASLRGEPWELPAGPVSVAFGVEGRREAIDQRVGELDAAKAFRSFNFSAMKGSFNVKEAFGEVLVPLVRDVPGLNNLALSAAARISDYNTTGSIWSWKLGFTNEFVDGFRGRVARSRDIRSANLGELFTTTTTGWSYVTDPTNNQTVYALSNGGGNPGLRPETADTLTAGLSWSPRAVEGLDLSVDYFNIDIKDVITTIGLQDILNRCAAGNAELCSRVERDAGGNITRIVSTYTNLSQYKTDGVDLEASYRRDARLFGVPGRLRLRTLATWVNSLSTDDGVKQMEYVGSQGYAFGLGVPKWRAVSSIAFDSDAFSVNARARYLSAGDYDRNQNIVNNRIGSYVYYDVGGAYRLGGEGRVELYASANNVFNKKAPIAATFSPYYDVMGAYYTAGVRVKF
ncbi:TonB-dependent receptor [Stenotrophomonas acidaminiphila]|uniref:TonB-dependent receptor domain-containing protein n=1 Tax=Stenotrophomonas acidaminiphila TaxID=128780 RepID=UPI0024054269|nr:TonB-dependent receptor [Stenotrophomonas acidaminiphila]MDF9441068.1 TonB-dependent receptor [Stenotrophomonas acidaminiphila]